jgi:hypothetical protein
MTNIKDRVDKAIKRLEELSPEEFRQEFIDANGGDDVICKNTGSEHLWGAPKLTTIVSCKICGRPKPRK